jgi:hypothetical protein
MALLRLVSARQADAMPHYELAVEEPVARRVAVAFDELALVI